MVETHCPITFTLRCEFNTIGLFDLSVPNPGPFRIIDPNTSGITIPIFSDIFNEKDFPLPYGWKIHARPIIKLDYGETEIDFRTVLGYGLEKMLDYHIQHHISPDLFINVKLRENNVIIDDGYYIDWNERKVKFQTVKYQDTYRLIISINQLYINDMLKMLYAKEDNGISSSNPKNSM